MKEENKNRINPDPGRHLDENELAQYAEYLRGERDDVPGEVLLHVEECASCRAEVMEVADMVDLTDDRRQMTDDRRQTTDDRRPKTDVRRLSSVIRLIASIAAVALIAWVIQQLRPEKAESERMATTSTTSTPSTNSTISTDSTISTISADESGRHGRPPDAPTGTRPDTVRYAQAFVPNTTLDLLVDAVYRSGTDPKAVGPGPETIFTSRDTLKISWTPDPRDSYKLLIVDNKGTKIIEIEPEVPNLITWIPNLKPGLYYWKLIGKEELWKVGRFRVIER